MTIKYTTPVSNDFFDKQMVQLSASAIRVYLKIIRNTHGWRNEYGEVKQRDWISHSQFSDVGVSSRSVTNAVEELLENDLIVVTNERGDSLHDARKRKLAKRIYYAPKQNTQANIAQVQEKIDKTKAKYREELLQNLLTTREKLQNSRAQQKQEQKELLSDKERLEQIIREDQRQQLKRNRWF